MQPLQNTLSSHNADILGVRVFRWQCDFTGRAQRVEYAGCGPNGPIMAKGSFAQCSSSTPNDGEKIWAGSPDFTIASPMSLAQPHAQVMSGKKPGDILANAPKVYADAGWVNFGDWLGNSR
jgi:hypothetical protein